LTILVGEKNVKKKNYQKIEITTFKKTKIILTSKKLKLKIIIPALNT
jgi:hypothetical protein